jgi:hypothetical protein
MEEVSRTRLRERLGFSGDVIVGACAEEIKIA